MPSRLPVRVRRAPLLAAACAAVALTGCSSSGSSGSSGTNTSAAATSASSSASSSSSASGGGADTIVIQNFAFKPASLTVAPGATVTVTNKDSTAHTVTSVKSGEFNTNDVAPGKTVTFKAPSAKGTYDYICTIHQFMKGTLTVS
ncbi:cupredoxin domain-containing protein [Streptomyces sp. CBMA29]|uniref:cupredoxin domain-containing protein n=1 Tax=Streptomyces sp. CBMA29 TaxID=1896314 RepID=UPI002948BCE7|nr:cupredoxin domain-containing protein [Streptomyces sp. CBMA29]MBD0735314.1 hypothetical protein [Streptomyces sp. CBMA29]